VILVGTPTFNRQTTGPATGCLLGLSKALDFQWAEASAALVTESRHQMVSAVLNDARFTHLIFIDADMQFRPEAILRMLAFDKPVVACACPRRELDLRAFHAAAKDHDFEAALARVTRYNVQWDGLVEARVTQGFIKVPLIGTGLMVITREALEKIAEAHPELLHRPAGQPPTLRCFETEIDERGTPLSEDWSFCVRWRKLGGDIWALVDEEIGHFGQMMYRGRYLDRLKQGLG
jgi:hypothetical protein